jgi:hypothetical protein
MGFDNSTTILFNPSRVANLSRFAELYIWKWNGYTLTNCERIEAIEIFAMKISALFATLSPI